MKNNLLIRFIFIALICGGMTTMSQAQFTTWEQGAASDWYINVNWAGPTNFVCDCLGGSTDNFHMFPPANPSNPVYEISRPHQAGSWSGSFSLEVGEDYTASYEAQMYLSGGLNNFITPCFSPCNQGYSGAVIEMSTDPLYPPGNPTATFNADNSLTFNWTVNSDLPEPLYIVSLYADGVEIWSSTSRSTVSTTVDCPENVTYSLRTRVSGGGAESVAVFPDVGTGPQANGIISGFVKTLSCNGEVGVTVKATLMNPEVIDPYNCHPHEVTAVTAGSNGNFTISGLTYGSGSQMAEYEVVAMLTDHEFRTFLTQTSTCNYSTESVYTTILSSADFTDNEAKFVDITSYVISGKVYSEGTICGVEGVEIREAPPGSSGLSPVMTEPDGTYSIVVPEGNKTYEIEAVYDFGSIADSIISVQVFEADVDNVDFIHTAKDTLKGFVGAGCQEFIGSMELTVSAPNGCELISQWTNASGFYQFILPSRDIELMVTDYDPGDSGLDKLTVMNDLDSTYEFKLDTTTKLDIIYRKPIKAELSGLPDPLCAAVPYPILEEGTTYGILLQVWEEINVCPADTGVIYISDFASGNLSEQILDTIPISNGAAFYPFIAGDPNLLNPHTKNIAFTIIVDDRIIYENIDVIVTGIRQRGSNFITAAPTNLPFLILHDPPGDGSYSSQSIDSTITYNTSYSVLAGGGVKIWAKGKVGTNIFGLKIWGQLEGSIEVGGSKNTTDEYTVQLTNTSQYNTSTNPYRIGQDLIVGAAVNFLYSLADVVSFDLNTCSIVLDTTIALDVDGFETTFAYTPHDIENIVIPNLQNDIVNSDLADSIRYRAEKEIELWEQVLQFNEDLKEEALEGPVSNFSFTGGNTQGPFSYTESNTNSRTIEFTTQINIGIAAEAGFEFNESGVTAGVDVSIRTEIGEISSKSVNSTTTTSWVFDDATNGDSYSFDVGTDPIYGTPVFGLRGGRTSCPYEPPAAKRDEVFFSVDPNVIINGNDAFYTFYVGNISETDEPRSYYLDFFPASNENGAVIYSGDPSGFPLDLGLIDPGNIVQQTITISRLESSPFYTFEGLEFAAYPSCDEFDYKSIKVSTFFPQPACSGIEMDSPVDGWLINGSSNNEIPVVMTGYDVGAGLDSIILQYRTLSSSGWATSNVAVSSTQLNPNTSTFDWNVTNLPDGEYEIRFRLKCGNTFNYSSRVKGLIDREHPLVFGKEHPTDDLHTPGDEISIMLNEEVDCSNFTPTDVYIKSMNDDLYMTGQLICMGDELMVIPDTNLQDFVFKPIEVGIINVMDMHSNERPDTIIWQFNIGDVDSDNDGISDKFDRCPGGNDFKDTDLGGLPDDCDCLPNDPWNDLFQLKNENNVSMDFDGVNDWFTIPNDSVMVPTDTNVVTFETWFNSKDVDSWEIIASAFNLSDPNTLDFYVGTFNDQVVVRVQNQFMYSTNTFTANTWNHLAVVFDTTETRIYLNGELDTTHPTTFGAVNSGQTIIIGTMVDPALTWPYYGQLDEVRFWRGARTEAQIKALMTRELTGKEFGLEAYYNFNQGNPGGDNTGLTTLEDQSQNGHDGTPSGFAQTGATSNWVGSDEQLLNPTQVAPELCMTCTEVDTVNAGMDFDGVNDLITIPNTPDLIPTSSNAMTIEAWIYPKGDPNESIFIGCGNWPERNYLLYMFNNQLIVSIKDFPGIFATDTIPDNQWTHVAVVFEFMTVSLYINGEFNNSSSGILPANLGFDIAFGNQTGNTAGWGFWGYMDDVRFWDHARTQEQIQGYMWQEAAGNESGLVAYYNFNEGLPEDDNTGLTTVPDVSGNGNTGTLSGFAKTGNTSNWITSPFEFSDWDLDGIPDICDDCNAFKTLTLVNQVLDGIYRAEEQIILGQGLSVVGPLLIELRAPEVKVLEYIEFSPGLLTIKPDGCNE